MASFEIVAEIACGHSGIEERLFELTKTACEIGATAVKFQIFDLNERAEKNTKEYEIFEQHLLPIETYRKAIKIVRKNKLKIFADVYGESSLNQALTLKLDAVKIHAEDANNFPLMQKVIGQFESMIISCGGANYKNLLELKEFLKEILLHNPQKSIFFVDGIQLFPTKREGHSLYNFLEINKIFQDIPQIKVGIADHIDPEDEYSMVYPCTATTLGARYIEKHLTISRDKKWTDWQSAFNPNQFKKLVDMINSLNTSMLESRDYEEMGIKYKSMFQKYPTLEMIDHKTKKITEKKIVYKKIREFPESQINYNFIKKNIDKISPLNKDPVIRFSNFNSKIGVIITVRMTSSRLPGKALLNINGIPSILVVYERAKKISGIDDVIVATSEDSSDDALVNYLTKKNIKIFRGDLDSVPKRLHETAKYYKFDHIIRITGDSVCLDYDSMSHLLDSHKLISPDCSMLKNAIFGTNKEILTYDALKFLAKRIIDNKASEYLEYFFKKPSLLKVNEIKTLYDCPENIIKNRLTLDYKEDLIAINNLYDNCAQGYLSPINEIIRVLASDNFIMVNRNMTQKNPYNLNLNLNINYK